MVQNLPSESFVPPRSSFNVPVAPPEDTLEQVALCIPATWLPVVYGAMQQLVQPTTWKGTEEEIAAAQTEAATIIAQMADSCGVSGDTPTPFWDNADDVDDEADPAVQTWYGEVDDPLLPPGELTFIEDVGIWAFTGLLAVSGLVGAAIAFRTFAPDFTLAMRGGDFGEVIRVIIDAQDYVEVDTTGMADEIIEVPIFPQTEAAYHDILLIKKG